jgi:hypothetical protein
MAQGEPRISGDTEVAASPDLLWCDLAREVAILNPESGKYFLLQAVGATVWKLIQAPRSVEDIESSLSGFYEVEPARCREDLRHLIEALVREGLVVLRRAGDQ